MHITLEAIAAAVKFAVRREVRFFDIDVQRRRTAGWKGRRNEQSRTSREQRCRRKRDNSAAKVAGAPADVGGKGYEEELLRSKKRCNTEEAVCCGCTETRRRRRAEKTKCPLQKSLTDRNRERNRKERL